VAPRRGGGLRTPLDGLNLARSRTLVLAATLTELSQHGWAGADLDRIAAASGVSRATIQGHWPDRATLLAEAALASVPEETVPDEGDLRKDLRAVLRGFGRRVGTGVSGAVVATLLDASRRDDRAGHTLALVVERLCEPLGEVLTRAGLPAATLDVDRLAGPVLMRAALRRRSPRGSEIDALVDAYLG